MNANLMKTLSDAEFDALVAARPFSAPAGMPERVARAVERERRALRFSFVRDWVFAACLAVAGVAALSGGAPRGADIETGLELEELLSRLDSWESRGFLEGASELAFLDSLDEAMERESGSLLREG